MKIFLTVFLSVVFWFIYNVYSIYYSVLSGRLTASQLDDTSSSFVEAKIIRDGHVGTMITILYVAFLWLLWRRTILRKLKNQTK